MFFNTKKVEDEDYCGRISYFKYLELLYKSMSRKARLQALNNDKDLTRFCRGCGRLELHFAEGAYILEKNIWRNL